MTSSLQSVSRTSSTHDPFPVYRELRDTAPCYHNAELGFYALSRYDDVRRPRCTIPTRYCSRYGITLERGSPLPMLLTTDPPDHTKLRRLVSRAFTPRRISDLEAPTRAIAPRYLDAIDPTGRRRPDPRLRGAAADRRHLQAARRSRCRPGPPARVERHARCTGRRASPTSPPPVSKRGRQLYEYFCAFVTDRRARARTATTSPPRCSRPRATASTSTICRWSASCSC